MHWDGVHRRHARGRRAGDRLGRYGYVMGQPDDYGPIPVHQTTIELGDAIPSEVDAGTDVGLSVRVSCPAGCDLRGGLVQVHCPPRVAITAELTGYTDSINETGAVASTAPDAIGQHAWSVLFCGLETESVVHGESCLSISFATRPHATSVAVWDVPSPVVMSSSFTVKVGIKCSVGCQLTGHAVAVCDETGTAMGDGELAATPWPGTESLHWAEVELVAPPRPGVSFWSVRFADAALPLPHDDTPARFSLVTAKLPEHRVTLTIVADETGLPVADVEVRVGPYERYSDGSGLALFDVPKGVYSVSIRKDGHNAWPVTVDVDGDMAIQVVALVAPTKAEMEEALRRFENYPFR